MELESCGNKGCYGFRALGFGDKGNSGVFWGLGLGVKGLEFKVEGLGFRASYKKTLRTIQMPVSLRLTCGRAAKSLDDLRHTPLDPHLDQLDVLLVDDGVGQLVPRQPATIGFWIEDCLSQTSKASGKGPYEDDCPFKDVDMGFHINLGEGINPNGAPKDISHEVWRL